MALSKRRRSQSEGANFWPGFVDAMATLLLVFTFLLSMFALAQFFASQEANSKDNALSRLNRQLAELTQLLSLEKSKSKEADDRLSILNATLSKLRLENQRLGGLLSSSEKAGTSDAAIAGLQSDLDKEKNLSKEARNQVTLLNQQLAALRQQIAALNSALEASEQKDAENTAQIKDLGNRLNVALAKRVQELSAYQSNFFGKLRKVLGNRPGIRIVGDRFVFQSEVLFPSGSDEINPQGRVEMAKLAGALKEIQAEIPNDIDWVMRVDGHTDKNPIRSEKFPSNWELSTARAISVVRFLISQGIPAKRLVAAGFGENRPLALGDDVSDLAKNRRIELKLTQR